MARSRRKPPQREGLGEPSSSVLAVASHLGRRRVDDRQPTSLCIHAWRGRREVQILAASPTPVGMSEFVGASPHSAALFLTAARPLPPSGGPDEVLRGPWRVHVQTWRAACGECGEVRLVLGNSSELQPTRSSQSHWTCHCKDCAADGQQKATCYLLVQLLSWFVGY